MNLFRCAALSLLLLLSPGMALAASTAPAYLEPATHLPLDANDAELYGKIFAYQEKGDLKTADKLIPKIGNPILMGHVLAQRYLHPTAYRAKWEELNTWMKDYSTNADALRIWKLALHRKPDEARDPPSPRVERGIVGSIEDYGFSEEPYQSTHPRSAAEQRESEDLFNNIRKLIRSARNTEALGKIDSKETAKRLDQTERDMLRTGIAANFFYGGNIKKARNLAKEVAERSAAEVPRAAWLAGLTAWHEGDLKEAASQFRAAAQSEKASPYAKAAAAFWAGRMFLKNREPAEYSRMLAIAARYPTTFYGIIASSALGINLHFQWGLPELSPKHIEALSRSNAGKRAIALLQAGQRQRAEAELRQIHPRSDRLMSEALLALAAEADLPALSLQLASALTSPEGDRYDSALYPLPPWEPEGGYTIDQPLLFAFMRQESRFDPRARNTSSGASGLMQILPRTARSLDGKAYNGSSRYELYHPETNIDLGQKYVSWLLDHPSVGGDLFKLAIAYNAGPGNLTRWLSSIPKGDDPLTFIETIPGAETRTFVQRVLTNLWIYRLRLGEETPSLRDIAEGRWPSYTHPEK
ncbi:MAG TPA: transglycosylase [Rhodospirillaceae bacterium]|nr:MAG: hypothetical protein A2018_07335 [Alphaproteobacteria bacterium GWF2_58_20]HAU29288.1 transglycosylase [Rhodospirillaceae bacterium]